MGGIGAAIGDVSPFDTKSVDTFHKDADEFNTLADAGSAEGGFAINEAGFQAYNKLFDAYIGGWDGLRRESAPLGASGTDGIKPLHKEGGRVQRRSRG